MDSPLHGRERRAKESRDSFERHLIEEPQPEHQRVLGRQALKPKLQLVIALGRGNQRVTERVNLFEKKLVQVDSSGLMRPLAFSEAESAMLRNGRKPSAEFRRLFD